jgi:hypothetical protein
MIFKMGKTTRLELTGQVFGRLKVLENAGVDKEKKLLWKCECVCGNSLVVVGGSLRSGLTKSCGCLRKEVSSGLTKTHGMREHPLYSTWCNIKGRCLNTKRKEYNYYGRRGIRVCDEWVNDFPRFLSDMGDKPSSKHSIDRVDNNGNYCKENCRWSTKSEQSRNCRNTVLVDWNGLKFKLVDLLEIYNINLSAMRSRLKCKWGIERALLTPIKGLPPLELDNSFNIINLL